ncbi:MAG: O-succinylhomoserine sulfhydrylase, partial [Gammaproteobacteria bacterium]
LDGQGRCVGGAVIGSESLVGEEIFAFLRTAGPTMSAFNAWVFLKGLETLGLRMREHCRNAQLVAEWLTQQDGIQKVYYPGLPDHPQHALAKTQQSGFGGIVSFELVGGRKAAWQFIDATKLFSITANLGDAKSTITHPATTTHNKLSDEERQSAGINEGLIRLSVGFEDIDDIQADLQNGLAKILN